MSKRKTVLKFSIAALLLGGSSTVAVLYFPYVALAIKFGIVISTAPLAIFAISVVAALVSVITLAAFTISAIRSKGKSNKVSSEPRSKNEEEGESLVQEKEQAVPILTPPLLSQEPEKSVIPIPQQPPVDDPVKETETPQPENVMVKGADQQANQTEESLPSYPETNSPLNSMNQFESFPSLSSIIMGAHNNLEDGSNSIKNYQENMSLPPNLPEQSLTSQQLSLALRAILDDSNSLLKFKAAFEEFQKTRQNNLRRSKSLPNLNVILPMSLSEVKSKWRETQASMTDSYISWGSDFESSIQEPDRLQASLGSDNSSVQSFQPKKKLLYDVNKKNFDSVGYQVNSRPSENAGEAPNDKREFPLTETNVNSGPEAMPYDVNENRASYSSMQSPVLSSSASRGNSFSG
ncbi:hypothetical protein [Wolbachia endosymbiont (group A) of Limnophora tigrina]|uniref:hypothetical protein n=1 Tax=Wolbachia endosymbiont (group A) of Limnophora tigrina TaxID=3139318 RepID=UPI0035B5680E